MTKVLIALPGNSFSGKFMMNLVDIVIYLRTKDYKVYLMNEYSSFVAFSRMKTLPFLRSITSNRFIFRKLS